ncbi:GCN5 family acetyltransferase [Prauserella marina]|uniref:Ribosomal protein S18 acetylase RimI n=1 Tax=Prauserella marina TaxID=530584 RepID=A0A222VTA7_9PSEU|nr:GNAT family N-acetyltransferase [Prauserella marina]ASR37167.1 GCN5 family acetyltransferase [Prauserella marina]PWV72477.1 ribosomal protein S18 acetylase RimI-like enzyme [Prauserella marina]SDD79140.1 Ribosomal protein S18 acetylase RimI [Prauserella marina]
MSGFAGLDPLLPERVDAGEGERIGTALPGGGQVTGVLYRASHEGLTGLWHARHTWELTPSTPAPGAAGMTALLRAVRDRITASGASADSAVAVTWPSRAVDVIPALVERGLVPYSVLAVRDRLQRPEPAGGVAVRRAGEADLDELTALWLSELRYGALVGSSVPREGAAELLAGELRRALGSGEPVWVAESGGIPVGFAACGRPSPDVRRLPQGGWGHVGTVSVASAERGTGIGRALMATAHRELLREGARGTFLFYSPHNALSSVFWHRQGYRPLWTTWEVRPASALR